MFRLNVRVSEDEYRMLRDLRLALFLESDSAVIRHLITEGYASELAAIEDAKRMKAARDERQLKIPFRGDPNETIPVTRLVSEESVVEGEPAPVSATARAAAVEAGACTQRPPTGGKFGTCVEDIVHPGKCCWCRRTMRRVSFHESKAALARKKKKQAKERGHKSRGIQVPKSKRGGDG